MTCDSCTPRRRRTAAEVSPTQHYPILTKLVKIESNWAGKLTLTHCQCLNRRIDFIDTLRAEVAAWQAARDRIRAKVDWQFATDDGRVKLKRLYPMFDV